MSPWLFLLCFYIGLGLGFSVVFQGKLVSYKCYI